MSRICRLSITLARTLRRLLKHFRRLEIAAVPQRRAMMADYTRWLLHLCALPSRIQGCKGSFNDIYASDCDHNAAE
ncbi:hypothetical protein BAUCODRAFT_35020 [Baudoinia panamericana UAMH 10762]|uniref:Uncharacterized protein n=1 Tax=Baudoinia panamericana (strain UAMH 10762) TaxID=717646 RepID=M2N8A0_BAUPA|nr:uncharacterized protein BAUCODRAFT_35020 [Baudoinia panamericana UAMH 10762]EMC95025.1 hypothetical protein BAUCODRAFT_35020 [Baudoinia panamericana UAMH 10762]